MKILILNGSPRKGNTVTAINAFVEGAKDKHEIEVVDTYKLSVSPCIACKACQLENGCFAKDDSTMIADKAVAADMIVFATPVYWTGITAQLKLVMDKMYCREKLLGGKKVGTIVVGGDEVEGEQYHLIERQFAGIADFIKWEMVFNKAYCAYNKDDLANNVSALEDLKAEGSKL